MRSPSIKPWIIRVGSGTDEQEDKKAQKESYERGVKTAGSLVWSAALMDVAVLSLFQEYEEADREALLADMMSKDVSDPFGFGAGVDD